MILVASLLNTQEPSTNATEDYKPCNKSYLPKSYIQF